MFRNLIPQLAGDYRALSKVSGILPHAPAAYAGGIGK
jgi:hypothetical protein